MTENQVSYAMQNHWREFGRSPVDWMLTIGLIAISPMLWIQAGNLWTKQHLQFFPLAWLAFLLLVLTRGQLSPAPKKVRIHLGIVSVALSIILAAIGVIRFSPWLVQIASTFLVLGWMLVRLGNSPLYTILGWTTLLFIATPLPMNLDVSLIQSLQQIASQSASSLLDLFSIPHLLKGNVIQTANRELFVDQACSGVDSLYALFAALLMLLLVQRQSLLISGIMLAILPLWSWAGNLIRISTIAIADVFWRADLSSGWQHTAWGLVLFSIVFLAVLVTHRSLLSLLSPMRFSNSLAHRIHNQIVRWPHKSSTLTKAETPNAVLSSPIHSRLGFGLSIASTITFILIGLASLGPLMGIGPWKKFSFSDLKYDIGTVQAVFSQDSLPPKLSNSIFINGFEITHRESNHFMGEYSSTWSAQDGELQIQLSLDFPFAGYHTLDYCYELTGFTKVRMEDRSLETSSGTQYFKHVYYVDPSEQPAFMMFTLFYQDGSSLEEPSRLLERLLPEQPRGLVYQLQVFISNSSDISEAKKEEYQQLLLELKERLIPLIHRLAEI